MAGFLAALALACAPAAPAATHYPAHVPTWWHAYNRPAWFRDALCIHHREGSWTDADTGGGGDYGGMQITLETWRDHGGRGRPDRATPREQLYRAWLVWKADGRSWREWPNTARLCGLPRD